MDEAEVFWNIRATTGLFGKKQDKETKIVRKRYSIG